jgi:catechol 2,3-dioxygenase-like lactoylglutathione lyase family enzyme
MIIQRIVPNLSAGDISKARQFYGDILGLEIAMDLGWMSLLRLPRK